MMQPTFVFPNMKNILIILFLIIASSASAQFSSPSFSFGLVYSDIKSSIEDFENGNTWRRGGWASISTDYAIKKWLCLEGTLTYQERKALEVFPFPFGDSTQQDYGFNMWIFSKYPTSPQNNNFNEELFIHFPNFKYLTIEFIPKIVFGSKWKFSAGIGFFYGQLLNKDEVKVTRRELPNALGFFEPPFNLYGEVHYHSVDYGWIPKLSAIWQVNEKLTLGIMVKSYQSSERLNDTFVDPDLRLNMRWTAVLGGLSVQYKFGKGRS